MIRGGRRPLRGYWLVAVLLTAPQPIRRYPLCGAKAPQRPGFFALYVFMFLNIFSNYINSLKTDGNADFSYNDKRANFISLAVVILITLDSAYTIYSIEKLIPHRTDEFFVLTEFFVISIVIVCAALLITTLIVKNKNPNWLRYLLTAGMIYFSIMMTIVMDYDVAWYFLIPTLVSCLHYRPLYTFGISVFMILMIPIATIAKELMQYAFELEGNLEQIAQLSLSQNIDTIRQLKRISFDIIGFNMLEIGMEMAICMAVAQRGRRLTIDQANAASENGKIQRELEIAQKIQLGLHPKQHLSSSNLEISAWMAAAAYVGGDLYDFFKIDDSKICIAIADVSGHGIPAAIFASAVKTIIYTYAQMHLPVDVIMTKVNEYLCQNNTQKLFVTAWIAIVDNQTGHVDYCNAGHNPPCILRHDQQTEFIQMSPNFVLARRNTIHYSPESLQLNPGDSLYIYTDGVTELNDQNGELFGKQRLLDILNKCNGAPQQNLSQIQDAIHAFALNTHLSDDITMLMLQYTPHSMESSNV